jgi:hypothetical protein
MKESKISLINLQEGKSMSNYTRMFRGKMRMSTCRIILITSLAWLLIDVIIIMRYTDGLGGGIFKKNTQSEVAIRRNRRKYARKWKHEQREKCIIERVHEKTNRSTLIARPHQARFFVWIMKLSSRKTRKKRKAMSQSVVCGSFHVVSKQFTSDCTFEFIYQIAVEIAKRQISRTACIFAGKTMKREISFPFFCADESDFCIRWSRFWVDWGKKKSSTTSWNWLGGRWNWSSDLWRWLGISVGFW